MSDPDDLEPPADPVDEAEQQADWADDDTDPPALIDADRVEPVDEESADFG